MDLRSRVKRAELASAIGALVVGTGIGALAASRLARYGGPLLLLGVATHGLGMWDRRRLQRHSDSTERWWEAALYWVCWIGLLVLVGWVLIR